MLTRVVRDKGESGAKIYSVKVYERLGSLKSIATRGNRHERKVTEEMLTHAETDSKDTQG